MKRINVKTSSKSYDVLLGKGMTEKITTFISTEFPDVSTVWIIADEAVFSLYGNHFSNELKKFYPVTIYKAPSGEQAKSFDVYHEAITHGLRNHVDRRSLVIAFGGGAIGDLAGFVASTFMRGIPFIGVPTTILAHDSAVGGKVAINHPLGKNMVGQFYQPEGVFFDLNYFDSLPAKEVLSGYAEVIKHAFLSHASFLDDLKTNFIAVNELKDDFILDCLIKGIKVKSEIVSKDEKEADIRAYLNFGHTYGHAVESASGYGNRTHGESVMIGMVYALYLSKRYCGLSINLEEFIRWVSSLGYDLSIHEEISFEHLLKKMKNDKKSKDRMPVFVLLREIGDPVLMNVPEDGLAAADRFIRDIPKWTGDK
ncbi:3-dehydroquinate synthase [Bacillus haikouensis]|uniref:3-dehydroquinate synthase n=1 Tax=Bacillus haikouensis TaxID=1510468 RepID=UPI00155635FC|nr:3-dehydroquinate synthase [Bacillus haikouensis]NQD66291.1 3-dehydroquinate synthase [Bacillus haikouensis]